MYPHAGCTGLSTTLPHMTNGCMYRQCTYGGYPWIDLDGNLEISSHPTSCPAGYGVPQGYVSGDDNPCTVQGQTCAGEYVLMVVQV